MIKQWNVEKDWQEPFLEALRARGASPQQCDTALRDVNAECTRRGASAHEIFGDATEYGKDVPVTTTEEAKQSRVRALLLAVAGLAGMFFALLGWTGKVKDVDKVWGANPVVWLTLGLVIAVAAAIGDTLLGSRADFTQDTGRSSAGATFVNRLLPWVIVVLTLVGMLVIQLRHG